MNNSSSMSICCGKSLSNLSGQYLAPSSDIEQYIAKVRQFPVLCAEEEYNLAKELHEKNSLEAAQKLVLHHLKFVVHIARGFSGYGLPIGDLIQEGNVGLMKAIKRFQPERGVRLVSFAVHWIKSEIHEFVIRNWRMVKIATTKAQRKLFFNLRSMKNGLGWLNETEANLIADELNVNIRDVYEMESRIHGQDVAFDISDSDDDDEFSPSAWLTEEGRDPSEYAEQEEQHNLLTTKLNQGLKQLDARSLYIINSRWLSDGKRATLQELADKYKVSAERIRQIEQQAMQSLQNFITAPQKNSA